MKTLIAIDNMKCGGCANSIKKELKSISHVQGVEVDLNHETIALEYSEGLDMDKLKRKLATMGYPEKGTMSGLPKMAANAKSYISCAIGRMSEKED